MSRTVVAIGAAVGVVVLVVAIIAVSLIPLPDFDPLTDELVAGSLAFVDDDNCVRVANLRDATITELRCEPEQGWIDEIAWTADGVEITAYLNQPTTRVLDPDTGDILETRTGEEVISEPPSDLVGLVVDRPDEGTVAIYDEQDRVLLTLEGPERYWIDSAIPETELGPIAFTDSQGRLAVFDRDELEPYLVAESVRSWPHPVWMP